MAGVGAGIATAILVICQAWLLSRSVVTIFSTGSLAGVVPLLWLLLAVFAGRAVLAWAQNVLAVHSSAAVKSQLRADIMTARLARPTTAGAATSSVITLVTKGLDALDGYFSKYLPQLALAATVPFIVGAVILWADWPSAIIVAFTLPLIPLFMALIGWTTQSATARRFAVQQRLANHFADLVEGLPTLQAFGRARAQERGVVITEDANRRETMRTLYVSFLSAFALELLATLSVAVIAVTIGTRLLYGQVSFEVALFVLILAPEAFLPVRQVGVHFHDSADGVAAADAAFEIIDAGAGGVAAGGVAAASGSGTAAGGTAAGGAAGGGNAGGDAAGDRASLTAAIRASGGANGGLPRDSSAGRAPSGGRRIAFEGVGYRYAGAEADALSGFSLAVEPGEIVALAGTSGGGKSTALALLMGFIEPSEGVVRVGGSDLSSIDLDEWRCGVAWVAQNPGMLTGTVGENVAIGSLTGKASDEDVRSALADAGADFGPDKHVGDDGEGLSAGERRRVALARALLRIRTGARLLVLDEPTAGLDADTEARALESVKASGAGALVVSHRPAVLAAADRVVRIGGAA